jgi:hypothetical protein
MPLQGHWARQNAPLIPSSRREARVLLVTGLIALAATALVCWALLVADSPNARPGCKRVTVAMSTGGATIEHCQSTER